MTTIMTTDQRERIVLREQRQRLRQLAREHVRRAHAELNRLHEDLVRCEALFADRMELEAIPSFRDTLAKMAGEWRKAATRAGAEKEIAIAATLGTCAEQIESLLAATEHGEPR